MLKRAWRKLYYAVLLVRTCSPKVFLHQMKRQIYSRATLIGMEKDLAVDGVPVSCQLEYSLRLASVEDMKRVLEKAKSESKESCFELIQRLWFYKSGFHNCYVARTVDTGDLCHLLWLISSKDDLIMNRSFSSRLPRPKKGEILGENAFTFEKYRGKGIMTSALVRMTKIARSQGFKRWIVCINKNNMASLKAHEMAGFRKFEEIPERKLLFFTKREYS